MLKIKLEHGRPFGQDSSYSLRMTVYQSDTKQFCDVIFNASYLSKLTEKELDEMCQQIQYSFQCCSENLLGLNNRGVAYEPLIAE